MIYTTTTQKAADATNANGLHTTSTGADFLTGAATEQDIQAPNGKAIATQIAHLALAGHAVHKGHCGDFTVCKYGLAKYCQDFDELQAFSRKLGVTK
jgi:hypothetical protein